VNFWVVRLENQRRDRDGELVASAMRACATTVLLVVPLSVSIPISIAIDHIQCRSSGDPRIRGKVRSIGWFEDCA
jgi:hypothetical protein